jgi:uncharacterized protein YkwD
VSLARTGRVVACAIGVGLLCLIAVPVAGSTTSRAGVRKVSSLETELLREINSVRADHNLQPLKRSRQLAAAAGSHSRAMATQGFFAHNSSDGTVFWSRIERFYASSGYRYWSVGENLVWAAPDLTAAEAVDQWLQSAPHRANLLSPRWREIGLAAVHADSAPGAYGNQAATIVTADFGVRR